MAVTTLRGLVTLGTIAARCGRCGGEGMHPVVANAMHRECRCRDCESHIRFVPKGVALEPVEPQARAKSKPDPLRLDVRDRLAFDHASRWLAGQDERPTDAEADDAIASGYWLADRFLGRRTK